jgi:hypothetical protein
MNVGVLEPRVKGDFEATEIVRGDLKAECLHIHSVEPMTDLTIFAEQPTVGLLTNGTLFVLCDLDLAGRGAESSRWRKCSLQRGIPVSAV